MLWSSSSHAHQDLIPVCARVNHRHNSGTACVTIVLLVLDTLRPTHAHDGDDAAPVRLEGLPGHRAAGWRVAQQQSVLGMRSRDLGAPGLQWSIIVWGIWMSGHVPGGG